MKVRYLPHQNHDAATNMAIDQALVQSAAQTGTHCLRFYGWSQPTLSMGYFQNHRDGDRYHRNHAVPVSVRRSTGGGAIVHHHDLTYSIALATDARTSADRDRLYRQTHDVFARALLARGVTAVAHRDRPAARVVAEAHPFLCFERRADEDLIVNDYKILGSAQRRIRGALLQHGSVLLSASVHAASLPGFYELTNTKPDPASMSTQLAELLSQTLGWTLQSSGLSEAEATVVSHLRDERFGTAAWWSQR